VSSGFRKAPAVALATALAVAAFVGLAYAGGVAGAHTDGPSSAAQYGPPPARVTVCHRTGSRYRTITIARSALRAHLRHGDTPGSCSARLNGVASTSVSLRTTAGRRVRTLRRGSYWIVVSDRSRSANFHLTGPRVNRRTTARFRGTARWRVLLVRGTYRYRADVGAVGGGTFRVR
jgi:hypothetical protein